MLLVFTLLLSVSMCSSNIYHVTKEYNSQLENEICMGDVINCTTVFPPSNYSRLFVRHFNTPEACLELDLDYNENVEIDAIYKTFSTLPSFKHGSILPLISSDYFNVKIMTINRDLKYSMSWLIHALNFENRVPTLYVLVIPRIKFTSIYHKLIFNKILESRQILHIISLEGNEYNLAINSSNVETMLNISAQLIDLNHFSIKIGENEYNKTFNFMTNLACDFPMCYFNCSNIGETDLCIELDNRYSITPTNIMRHFQMKIDTSRLDRIHKRSFPTWFLNWLQSKGELFPDRALNPFPIMNNAIISDGSTLTIGDTLVDDLQTLSFAITMKKNNSIIPVFNMANCYHGIINQDSERKCLIYNVE